MSDDQQREIEQGSLVGFSPLAEWRETYGNGPFRVHSVQRGLGKRRYVSLKDMKGKLLPLGGGEGLISASFVEPYKP